MLAGEAATNPQVSSISAASWYGIWLHGPCLRLIVSPQRYQRVLWRLLGVKVTSPPLPVAIWFGRLVLFPAW